MAGCHTSGPYKPSVKETPPPEAPKVIPNYPARNWSFDTSAVLALQGDLRVDASYVAYFAMLLRRAGYEVVLKKDLYRSPMPRPDYVLDFHQAGEEAFLEADGKQHYPKVVITVRRPWRGEKQRPSVRTFQAVAEKHPESSNAAVVRRHVFKALDNMMGNPAFREALNK